MTDDGGDAPPAGWAVARLPDLVAARGLLSDGDWVESKDQDPFGAVRLTQLADIGDGFFRDRSNRFMTAEKAQLLSCTFLEAGDIMVARMPEPLGRACVFPGSPHRCVTVVDVCVLRAGTPLINSRWLMNFINAPTLRAAISRLQAGTTRKRISKKNLCTIEIVVPPAGEQQRIVEAIESYFTRLDDAVATLERVERNLKRYRASVLKSAIEGRLVATEAALAKQEGRDYEPASDLLERILTERRRRWAEAGEKGKYEEPAAPPDTSNLPELPEGWCWATVDAVGDVLLGRQRAPQYLTGKYFKPYLRVANVKDDSLDLSDVEEMDFDAAHFEKYRLLPGDILISEGQSLHAVGQSAMYRGGIDGLCFQKTLHRFRPFSPGPSGEFAQLVFRAHVKSGVFMRLASITTNIAHLTLVKFQGSRFPLPPEAEQERIVKECARLMSQIDAAAALVRRQALRCRRLRQSILKRAFEGKLADQDPDDEPASVLLDRIKAERGIAEPARAPRRQPAIKQKKGRV